MSDIVLVRQQPVDISDADKDAARRVFFGIVDGLGEKGRKQWRRLVNGLLKLEPGEMVEIHTNKQRSGPFHRFHMALESRVFEAQERIGEFEDFRLWLKVGAGHVNWMAGAKGGVVPVPKSIAYSKLDDEAMREFHDAAIAFLRTPHASKYLWPKASPVTQAEAIELILAEFDR